MSFTYTLNSKSPVAVLALYGELIDRTQGNELSGRIEALAEENIHKIVLDLSELKYMNSTGLNVLINTLSKTRKNGGDLVLCGISRKIQELLLVTKLNSVFTVTDTADEAVARFNS